MKMSSILYVMIKIEKAEKTRLNYAAASNIFSIKMPYPVVGSFTRTWVTAPTNLLFCRMGEPRMCVFSRNDVFIEKNTFKGTE